MKTTMFATALVAAALLFPRAGQAAAGGPPMALVVCESSYLGIKELGPVPMKELASKLRLCRGILQGRVMSIEIIRG